MKFHMENCKPMATLVPNEKLLQNDGANLVDVNCKDLLNFGWFLDLSNKF